MKYLEKSIIIDAYQYNENYFEQLPLEFIKIISISAEQGNYIRVEQGYDVLLAYGDWIIKNGRGHFQVLSNTDFNKTYTEMVFNDYRDGLPVMSTEG